MQKPIKHTILLGIFFLFLFTADTSFSTIITQVYQQKDLQSLGPALLAVNFGSFMFFSMFSPGFTCSYKFQFIISGICYSTYYAAGLILDYISDTMKYIVILSIAVLVGLASAALWTAFGGYMHQLCKKYKVLEQQGKYFGIWSGIYSIQSITGSIITTFALGLLSHQIYFAIITLAAILATLFCLFFIKNIQQMQDTPKQKFNAFNSAKQLFKFYPKMKHLLGIIFLDGVMIAFTYTSLTDLIPKSQTPQQQNLKAGIAFTFNGLGGILGGYFGGIIYDKFSLNVSTNLNIFLFACTIGITYLTTYIQNIFFVCFLFFWWGIVLYYFQIWILISCSRLYDGKLQSFAISKQFHSFSFVLYEILIIFSQKQINIKYIIGGMCILSIPMIIGFYFLLKKKGNKTFIKSQKSFNDQKNELITQSTI